MSWTKQNDGDCGVLRGGRDGRCSPEHGPRAEATPQSLAVSIPAATHSSPPTERAALRAHLNVNHGLGVIVTYQCGFTH